MAEVDSVRVFRGIYSGLALAMSETDEDLDFASLPSSDDIAHAAYQLSSKIISSDARETMRGAQQELTGLAVALAVLENGGASDGLNEDDVVGGLNGLWSVIGSGWAPAPAGQG